MTPPTRLRTLLIWALVCTNIGVFALSGYSLRQSRKQYELRAQTRTQNISSALDQSISGNIEKIDLALRTVADELEQQLARETTIDERYAEAFLARLVRRLPEIEGIRASNSKGLIVLGNGLDKSEMINVAGREFFTYHRDHADGILRVTKPLREGHAGHYTIAFAQRYSQPDGRFAGVVIATIPLDHFVRLLARLDVGQKGTIILRDLELGLIARHPAIPDQPAGQVGNSSVSEEGRKIVESGVRVATYHTPAGSDGLERIYTLRRLEKAPMIVNAGIAREDYLAGWTTGVYKTAAVAFGTLLISVLLGALLLRLLRDADAREKALSQSEELLRAITDNANAVIFLKDLHGRYRHINRRYEELFHITRAAAMGKTDHDIFPSATADVLAKNDQAVLQSDRAIEIEEQVPHDDGMHTYISVKFPLRNGSGEAYAVCGIATDITARKRAEQALREGERYYRHVIDSAIDGYFAMDHQRRFIEVNDRLCSLFGHPRDEWLGKTPFDFITEESQAELIAQIKRIDTTDHRRFQLIARRKDGTTFPILLNNSTHRNENGEPVGSFGFITDLTPIVEAQRAVAESERELRGILDDLQDTYYRTDEAGHVVRASRSVEQLLGYQVNEVLGRRLAELYCSPEDREAFLARMRANGGHVVGHESRLRHKDGHEVWVRTTAHFIQDAAGNIVGVEGTTRDNTQQRRAEVEMRAFNATLEQRVRERTAELEASNRELESFSYSISHDLRAPLRALHGYSHLLSEEYAQHIDAEGQHYLTRIRIASERMGEMIDDMLDLARVTRRELNRQPVSLGALADEILAELAEHHPERAVTWNIEPEVIAPADPVLMKTLLENLLRNAWKFTAERTQAHIEFSTSAVDGERVFRVRDNGAGFEMAYADKLFKPFQRLHDVARFEGTGIGLAIVQRIIQRHGGRVWCEGAPGKGASFYFTLP